MKVIIIALSLCLTGCATMDTNALVSLINMVSTMDTPKAKEPCDPLEGDSCKNR